MIALNNIDDRHIKEIAEAFADSFLAEEGVVSWSLDYDDAVQYFYHTLKEFVRCGRLFATSDMEEGFIVWYRKGHGLPWYRELLLTVKYMMYMSLEGVQKMILSRNGWTDYTMSHQFDRDYVDVCLVCVRREYQHQGILKQLLRQPFQDADENGLITILDTDAEIKMKKYGHEGMQVEKDAVLKSGIHMYTMIRRGNGHEKTDNPG